MKMVAMAMTIAGFFILLGLSFILSQQLTGQKVIPERMVYFYKNYGSSKYITKILTDRTYCCDHYFPILVFRNGDQCTWLSGSECYYRNTLVADAVRFVWATDISFYLLVQREIPFSITLFLFVAYFSYQHLNSL